MILLWMLTALAATPEELAESARPALEQLAACADHGCGPDEGAHAAFLVALYTYHTEGRADGPLAATVRYLDPALFRQLPDVIRDVATQPLEWAPHTLGVRARMPAALFGDMEPTTPYVAPKKPWRNPTTLTVTVLSSGDGAPVPQAVVRILSSYGERHQVNAEYGTWTTSVEYLQDGSDRVFYKGYQLEMEVTAPGFRPKRMRYTLEKRHNRVPIELEPWAPVSDGSPAGDAAIEAYQAWRSLVDRHGQKPTPARYEVADLARLEGAILARAWMDAGGGDDAHDLCLVMGSIPYCDDLPIAPSP